MLKLRKNLLLLRRENDEASGMTTHGIVILGVEKSAARFTVEDVGPDVEEVKKGDVVLIQSMMPDELYLKGEQFWITEEEDVVAICE